MLSRSVTNSHTRNIIFFFSAVSAYTSALKASIKSQTEFQPKLMASSTISKPRTDDIFTNLLIQHGRKALHKKDMVSTRREELLNYYGQASGTRVKRCEEIFACKHNPKSILLTGKAGIGKTLFCEKLIRSLELGGPVSQRNIRGAWKQQDVVIWSTWRQWRKEKLTSWLNSSENSEKRMNHQNCMAKNCLRFGLK